MDMSEILKKYEREWLLIEYQGLDENLTEDMIEVE